METECSRSGRHFSNIEALKNCEKSCDINEKCPHVSSRPDPPKKPVNPPIQIQKCPVCSQQSWVWNPTEGKYACFNPECTNTPEPDASAPQPAQEPVPAPAPVPPPELVAVPVPPNTKIPQFIIGNQPKQSNIKPMLISIFALAACIIIFEIYSNIDSKTPGPVISAPPPAVTITTPAPVSLTQTLETQSPEPQKPEYTKFSNPLNGYSIEYFTIWEVNPHSNANDSFTSTDGTFIEVRYERGYYTTLLTSFLGNKELFVESRDAIDSSFTYSVFTKPLGNAFRRVYLSDVKTGSLIIECTYGPTYNSSSSIDPFKVQILHIVNSFQLNN